MKRTYGTIIEHKNKGIDYPSVITVEYEVDNKKYKITETVKLVNKVIKLGFLPIGQKKIPKINCRVGNVITVIYDEKQPEKAYIDGNNGMINC